MVDLRTSKAYKRLRHFGLGIGSSSDSVLSFDSACSAGNWSILSDITLGDLSISQIAVLNLTIDLSNINNPKPFQNPSSAETDSRPRPRRIWSSCGRMHNAIENGNILVVRTLLAMAMDVEELDSNGQTPLLHAIEIHHVAICKILVEKGASITQDANDETLLTHATHMLFNLGIYDYALLDHICEALLDSRPNAIIKTDGNIPGKCIAVSMHSAVNGGYKSILQLLLLI